MCPHIAITLRFLHGSQEKALFFGCRLPAAAGPGAGGEGGVIFAGAEGAAVRADQTSPALEEVLEGTEHGHVRGLPEEALH